MNWNEVNLISIKTTKPKDESHIREVIEIGICKFNAKSLRRYEPLAFFVKPEVSCISDACTKFTGISVDDVDSAVSFSEACEFIKENYDTENKPWAAYGNFVEKIIKTQCDQTKSSFPFSDRFINLRHQFPLAFSQNKEEPNLHQALKRLGVFVSSNSCEDDVLNLGILFCEILRGGILK